MWFWLSAIAGIASASEKILNRIALKDRGNVLAYSFLYMSLISLLSLPFSLPFKISPDYYFVGLLLLQSIFWSLGTIFSFLSQTKTDVSLSMIISRARMLWMIPLGALFLNEKLSYYSIIGVAIIFAGLIVLFYKTQYHKHQGVHLMFFGSIFVALGSIVNAVLVRTFLSPTQTTFITMLSQSLVFLLVLIYRKNVLHRLKEVLARSWYIILTASVIETFAFFGLNYSFRLGSASLSTAVYLGMTIITVWIGIIFLKEKQNMWRKIISSAIVFLGIIIVKIFA